MLSDDVARAIAAGGACNRVSDLSYLFGAEFDDGGHNTDGGTGGGRRGRCGEHVPHRPNCTGGGIKEHPPKLAGVTTKPAAGATCQVLTETAYTSLSRPQQDAN